MGLKIKIGKPKIKIKAPKGISKAISSAVKDIGKVGKLGVNNLTMPLKAAGHLATGDFKGAAKDALGSVSSAGDVAGMLGGRLGAVVGQKKLGESVGETALDVGANIATSGGYGAAKAGLSSVAEGGLGGLLKGDALQNLAAQGVASQVGIDPNLVQGGMSAMRGDMKGAALQSLGSYTGIDPQKMEMAQQLAQGDTSGLASSAVSGLASKAGAGDVMANMAGKFAGGKSGRKVISDQAGAYAQDAANAALDQQVAGMSREDVKKIQDIQSKAQAARKIAQGGVEDLSGKIGKGVVESGKVNQAQFDADRAFQDWSSQQKGYIGKEKKAEMRKFFQEQAQQKAQEAAPSGYTVVKGDSFNAIAKKLGVSPEELRKANPQIKDPNKISAGANLNLPGSAKKTPYKTPEELAANRQASDAAAVANQDKGTSLLDDIKSGASSLFGGAKDFATEHKTGIGIAADVAAAGLGYKAGEAGRQEATSLSKQQLAELQRAGKDFEQIKYDPTRYKQEREFLQQRIAGGGLTPQEKLMQQQGDIRGAKMAAAARLAGLEQQARTGAGASGAGSALAASLAGAQGLAGTQAETNLQREASASQRFEQDIQRQSQLARQQTAEEADLAQQQGQFGLSRAQQTGAVRGDLGNIALGRAAALQKLYSTGADLAKQGLSELQTPEQQAAEDRQRQMQAESTELDLEKKRREVYGAPETTPPPQQKGPSQPKVGGAKILSQGQGTTIQNQPTSQKKPVLTQFNEQNGPQPGQGQGYGVLAPVAQQAAPILQKVQGAQQAVQKGQQLLKKVDEGKQKAQQTLNKFGIKF